MKERESQWKREKDRKIKIEEGNKEIKRERERKGRERERVINNIYFTVKYFILRQERDRDSRRHTDKEKRERDMHDREGK